MHEGHDPRAYLVEIPKHVSFTTMEKLEYSQIGVMRLGGSWHKIMVDGNIEHRLISEGRQSDYTKGDYDDVYRVISGNY
jgi:hypothetical protein